MRQGVVPSSRRGRLRTKRLSYKRFSQSSVHKQCNATRCVCACTHVRYILHLHTVAPERLLHSPGSAWPQSAEATRVLCDGVGSTGHGKKLSPTGLSTFPHWLSPPHMQNTYLGTVSHRVPGIWTVSRSSCKVSTEFWKFGRLSSENIVP